MSGGFNLDDYVDVAARIQLFYERYPDGRIVTTSWETVQVDERFFVVCCADAHRSSDDPRPCSGTAWEPIPGPTPYTRDSELMNAETAAWGRAIIAAGIPSKKIASSDEVKARQSVSASKDEPRTKAQNSRMHALISELNKENPLLNDDWKGYAKGWILQEFGKHSSTELTKAEAGLLIDHLEQQKVPFG